MKKFLVILFVLFSLVGLSQNQQSYNLDGVEMITIYGPEIMYPGEWGSFWFKIERTEYTFNGYYWYYIYAYSNSYLNQDTNYDGNPDKASTFVDHPTVTMYYYNNGYPQTYNFPMTSALFDWQWTLICYFYCVDPNATFEAKWNAVYPYNYSSMQR
jgi:hypothetical protein